jgi:hypothetical protein
MLWSPPAVCGTVHDAPAAVRWFSRLLFFRLPLADEVADFAAAIAWLRRRWLWVAAGYLVYVALLVVPGLLRERGGWYTAMAIIVPHLVLYLTAMMVAYSWVGYRINLGNLKQFLPKDGRPRRDKVRKLILIACISGVLGGVVGYMTGGSVKREGQAKGVWADAAQAFGQWNRDTFTPGTLTFIFLVMITGVPELIAQMRLKERTVARKLLEAEATGERLARVTAESELRLLQAQVEPHFLYNTLANLRFLVQSGSPDSLRMTDALIEYLRTSVPDMRAQQVTLGREFAHATHYLEIMQLRMQGRLTYSIELPRELADVAIPPLVVLTLVENAVKHGVAPLIEGGRVQLAAAREDDGTVRILDSEAAVPEQTRSDGGGTGIVNAFTRLRFTFGKAARLQLVALPAGGVQAAFWLPHADRLPERSEHDGVRLRFEMSTEQLRADATGQGKRAHV